MTPIKGRWWRILVLTSTAGLAFESVKTAPSSTRKSCAPYNGHYRSVTPGVEAPATWEIPFVMVSHGPSEGRREESCLLKKGFARVERMRCATTTSSDQNINSFKFTTSKVYLTLLWKGRQASATLSETSTEGSLFEHGARDNMGQIYNCIHSFQDEQLINNGFSSSALIASKTTKLRQIVEMASHPLARRGWHVIRGWTPANSVSHNHSAPLGLGTSRQSA